MKLFILIFSLSFIISCSTPIKINEKSEKTTSGYKSAIAKSSWIHGSENCKTNQDPVFDVYKHDSNSFIIRQNKCLTFEAPFIYILIGKQKILVLDTGAISDKPEFSLYAELERIIGKKQLTTKQILVAHSHSHSDHYKGDVYFDGHSNVKVIKTSAAEVRSFFSFNSWPQGEKTIDLGERLITVIPSPGHQEEAISIYDHKTKWLMTGDTLYPGSIYVKNWEQYRSSIDRLANFTNDNEVTAILGGHIEKKNKSAYYFPIGSTHQPDEANIDLSVESIHLLNEKLKAIDEPREVIFDDFIIKPMSGFQKILSNSARWLTQ